MNPALLSAVSAIGGSLVGAASSLITTLLTQRGQARLQARSVEITKREAVYFEFIAEAAKRLADGVGHDAESIEVVVGLHALIGRMRLMSSRPVVVAAERLVKMIIQTYAGPNQSFADLRENLLRDQDNKDPLMEFGEACRAELQALRN